MVPGEHDHAFFFGTSFSFFGVSEFEVSMAVIFQRRGPRSTDDRGGPF